MKIKILLVLLAHLAAALSFAQDVKVTKVENYGGTATVTTDAKNETIVVTALDADKKPIESWTLTTNADGKADVPSGYNLSVGYVKAKKAAQMPDMVAPSAILEGEVVMVALTGSAAGEVVDVKTVSGEVVASAKTDRLGRIVIPALVAGAYSLVRQGGGSQSLNVRPQSSLIPQSGATPSALGKPLSVPLNGPLTDPSQCKVLLNGLEAPVLASNAHEAVIAPPQNLGAAPGTYEVRVFGPDGEVVARSNHIVYEATSKLERTKVVSGSGTQLIVSVTPSIAGSATASILDGPVQFPNGSSTMTSALQNGKASFPIQSKPGGTGSFHLGWEFTPEVQPSLEDPGEPPSAGTTSEDEKVDAKKIGGSWVVDVTDKKTGRLIRRITGRRGKAEKTESWSPFDPRLGHGSKKTHEDLGPDKVRETTEKTDESGKTVSGTRETFEGKGKDTKKTTEHWEAGEGGKPGGWKKD